ncbi:acyl-CoA dehydrogenase family protein [Streptomyces sp. cmx-4-7]|uniref:acyl-CoA dehydrogenase family protein n=1 Tax=Streptomyces sp. cmx-4-7 TaxID=2790939 RepID=UPI0039802DC4
MTEPVSYGAQLFRGRLRTDLLRLPAGDPRGLPAEEEAFLERLRRYCAQDIDAEAIERDDRIPDEVIERLKDLGAMSIKLPTRWGGQGLSNLCYLRALMIVNSVHASLGELLAAHQAIGLIQPLLLFGTPRQQDAFLPRCVRGISAFALTEPETGNGLERLRTTAVLDPVRGTYTLNGTKLWTTNGVIADLLVVMADVPATASTKGGTSVFVVDADAPGVGVEHRSTFLGLRGLENGVIRLRDVVVPADHRIGEEGDGLEVALAAQDTGRLSLPAVSAASAKWSLRIAREWACARLQQGHPIGRLEPVAAKVASIGATAFALEAVVEVTARNAERDVCDTRFDAELAKLFAAEHSWRIADELLQLRGGRGYETASSAAARGERGVPVERHARDVRIGRIFDGSTEALRHFLADAVLLRRAEEGPAVRPDAAPEEAGAAPRTVLDDHRDRALRAAERLASLTDRLHADPTARRSRQRGLGRLVDIAAELYAVGASCAYAEALRAHEPGSVRLADVFCRQALQRVEHLFARFDRNTDADDLALAQEVFEAGHLWLEDGVIDTSLDGPWVAALPHDSSRPDLRRRVPRRTTAAHERPGNSDG